MRTTSYDMNTVIDLMAAKLLQGQDAKKAIRQAFYNQHCEIVNRINKEALSEDGHSSCYLSSPDAPQPFEIDFSTLGDYDYL